MWVSFVLFSMFSNFYWLDWHSDTCCCSSLLTVFVLCIALQRRSCLVGWKATSRRRSTTWWRGRAGSGWWTSPRWQCPPAAAWSSPSRGWRLWWPPLSSSASCLQWRWAWFRCSTCAPSTTSTSSAGRYCTTDDLMSAFITTGLHWSSRNVYFRLIIVKT